MIEWWPKPVIVPGRDSWATDLLRLAGGRNPLEHEDVKSRPLEPGELAEIDPDAVVLSWCGIEYEKYRESVALEREGCENALYVKQPPRLQGERGVPRPAGAAAGGRVA